jgi:hypothetical protein
MKTQQINHLITGIFSIDATSMTFRTGPERPPRTHQTHTRS